MKSIILIICSVLFLTSVSWAQTSDIIDPQKSEFEKAQLLSLSSIQDKIDEAQKIVIGEARDFEMTLIVTFEQELPEEYSADRYEAVQHVFMHLSANQRFLCEFRINMIWEHTPESKILSATVEEPGAFRCYPRI